MAPQVIEQYQQFSNQHVQQSYFTEEEFRDRVISSGRARGHDLVMVADASIHILAEQGFLQELTELRAELAPMLHPHTMAACGDYGLPYAWGTIGILYRGNRNSISQWQQLFTPPPQHQGSIVMYADPIDAVSLALLALNYPPYSSDVSQLKQAHLLLQQQQRFVQDYGVGLSYAVEYGANSGMTMAVGYSGEAHMLRKTLQQPDWQYVVPEQGTTLWTECLAIPRGAKHAANARQFLRFIHQPKVAADNAETMWFATPNQAALPLASHAYRTDPELFPPQHVLAKSHHFRLLPADVLRLRNRIVYSLR